MIEQDLVAAVRALPLNLDEAAAALCLTRVRAAAGVKDRHLRARVAPAAAQAEPLAGMIHLPRRLGGDAGRDVGVTAEDGPADRDAVAGAVHRGAGETGRLGRPEAAEHARDAGYRAGGRLAEDLIVVLSRLHIVKRGGDVLGWREVPRVRLVVLLVGLELVGRPLVPGRVPLVPGDDPARFQQIVDGFEAVVVVEFAVIASRDRVPRGIVLGACVCVVRIVEVQRLLVGSELSLDRRVLEQAAHPPDPLRYTLTLALVGDGINHIQDVLHRRGYADLARGHRGHLGILGLVVAVAGVEEVSFERAAIEDILEKATAVIVNDLHVLPEALVHPADGSKHREVFAHIPVLERGVREVFANLGRVDDLLRVLLVLLDGEEEAVLLHGERVEPYLDVVVAFDGVLKVEDVREHGVGWPVTDPAVVVVYQCLAVVAGHHAERLGDVRCQLQVQHLVDEDAKEVVERCRVRAALGVACGGRARPQPPAIEVVPLAGDLVHPLYGVHRDHVEREGE